MANAPARTPSTSTSTSTSTTRPLASDRIAELETEILALMDKAPVADKLVREVIAVKAEDIGCDSNPNAIGKVLRWGGTIGFTERLLEVVNEALDRMTGATPAARAFIAWQAVIGIVFRFRLPLPVVFRMSEEAIEILLKERTPEAHGRFCEDRNRAIAANRPQKPRSPLADRLAGKAEAKPAGQPPRGERGGNRGHGKGSQPKPAPQAPAPRPVPAEDDDDRQPEGLTHEVMSLANAAAAGGTRRR